MLILISLLTACVTKQKCERKFPARDSIVTTVNTVTVIRDTTIYLEIPGDTVFISVPMVEGEVSKLNTPMAISYAWVLSGKLNHRLEQRDTVVPKHIVGALKSTIEASSKEAVKTQVEFTNILSGFQWLQVYFGRVFIGMIIIFIGGLIGHVVFRR